MSIQCKVRKMRLRLCFISVIISMLLIQCEVREPITVVDPMPERSIDSSQAPEMEVWEQSETGTIQKIVIGFGSGKLGFDSFTVKEDGIELVINGTAKYAAINSGQLFDKKFMAPLKMLGSYYRIDGVEGGSQAFLVMIDEDGKKRSVFCDNYFPVEMRELWKYLIEVSNSGAAEWKSRGSQGAFEAYNKYYSN